jgi:hypothetical protein
MRFILLNRNLLKAVLIFLIIGHCNPAPLLAQSSLHHYLYVATPGVRNYLEYGGHGLLVFDIDNNFKFIKRIPTNGLNDKGQPSNVMIAVSLYTIAFMGTIQAMQCMISSRKKFFGKKYENGCDRMSISLDGKTIYLPSLRMMIESSGCENGECIASDCAPFPFTQYIVWSGRKKVYLEYDFNSTC